MAKNIPKVYFDAANQSDLPRRLRESAKACRALDRAPLLHEAADRIEALEALLLRVANKRQKGGRDVVDRD